MYYADILLPKEWEVHPDLQALALSTFTSAVTIENPNRHKIFRFKRLFRITLYTVTARRDVFTANNETIPI